MLATFQYPNGMSTRGRNVSKSRRPMSNGDKSSIPVTSNSSTSRTTCKGVEQCHQTEWTKKHPHTDRIANRVQTETQAEQYEFETEPNVEYETVQLQVSSAKEKLGLTLSCEQDGTVYISEIHPLGLAAQNGKLQEGDQIIQVNGLEAKSSEQVENLFRLEHGTIKLLLGRTKTNDLGHSSSATTMSTDVHDDYQVGLSKNSARDSDDYDTLPFQNIRFVNGNGTDSPTQLTLHMCLQESGRLQQMGKQTDLKKLTEKIANIQLEINDKNQETAEEPYYSNLPLIPPASDMINKCKSSKYSTRGELLATDKMESIKQWVTTASVVCNQNNHKNADLCREEEVLPFALDLPLTKTKLQDGGNSKTTDPNTKSVLHPHRTTAEAKKQNIYENYPKMSLGCDNGDARSPDKQVPPTNTMYTNAANLEHTIWLQQQLFRQTLQAHASSTSKKNSLHSSVAARKNVGGATTPTMEWKVKRRADGTRYITKRPTRNRLLKERARKLMEDRTLTTTDEESEIKWGKHWSRQDKKHHLERLRDHKRKRLLILHMKNTLQNGDEPQQTDSAMSNRMSILLQKKQIKKKGKPLLDDFVTVEEVLVHGTRQNPDSKYSGLLSVTTV